MVTTVTMPRLSETSDTYYVEAWLVEEGTTVQEGAELVEVETDKVTVAVPAPVSGVVVRLLVAAGTEITTGTPIVEIDVPDSTDHLEAP